MWTLLLAAAAQSALATAPAPAPDPVAAIRAQSQPIERTADGAHSGSAWDALVADMAGAQFAMVGEQHGSGDIARLETSLQAALAKRGFTHSALEVGPISTPFAERLIRSGPGKLQAYIAAPGHGLTLPFLFFGEEAVMAEAMVASSPDKVQALFGLDQEFVGAGPVIVEELRAAAQTPAQRQATADFAAAAAKDFQLVGTVTDEQLAPLARAFAANPRGMQIVEAMRITARIYQPFIKRIGFSYDANLERETYMKTNFVRDFEAAKRRNGKAPKVFLKFGGYHAMRGMSGTNVPGLGGFLAEWGLPQGYRLANIMIDCIGGESLNPQTGKAAPCEGYFGQDSQFYKAMADGPPVQIVNLKALRPLLRRLGVDAQTREVILAFDYYIAVRDGKAATPLGSPAG